MDYGCHRQSTLWFSRVELLPGSRDQVRRQRFARIILRLSSMVDAGFLFMNIGDDWALMAVGLDPSSEAASNAGKLYEMSPNRIILIDDHVLFRAGLRMVLNSGIEDLQMAEAGSLEEALRDMNEPPAVALLDIKLQGLNGLEGMALLRRKWPQTAVIVLSSDSTSSTVRSALERGAVAFVSKADSADSILTVIRQVLRGEPVTAVQTLPTEVDGEILTRQRLTPRQCEVLDLLCQGLSNRVIGQRLNLSEHTVRGHVQALLAALQVSSRSEAGYAARRIGLVD